MFAAVTAEVRQLLAVDMTVWSGLKDRVEAFGGRFSVQSPVGGGTRLDATSATVRLPPVPSESATGDPSVAVEER